MIELKEISKVQQYKSDVAFKTLVDGVNDNLYFIPKYQRKFRWSKEQAQELIRSLIKGYPIPPIYGYRNKEEQLEILDGQQRIMSLFFYYIGKFIKGKGEAIDYQALNINERKYEEVLMENYDLVEMQTILNPDADEEDQIDISYGQLPLGQKRKLDYTNITVIELRWENQENRPEDLQSIFRNLNKNGSILTEQEAREGVFDSAFYDMLRKINKENENWKRIRGKENSKGADKEFLLRLCTVRKYVDYQNGHFEIKEYQGKYAAWMDKFSNEAVKMDNFEIEEYKQNLENFFEKFDINTKCGSKIALLESIYVVIEKCKVDCTITDEIYKKILGASKYKDTSRQGTVKKARMNERWNCVYEILSQAD